MSGNYDSVQSCVSFALVSGTLVMLASAVHNVAKYYHRPKRSSNKIRILQIKFKFRKKTNLTSLTATKTPPLRGKIG